MVNKYSVCFYSATWVKFKFESSIFFSLISECFNLNSISKKKLKHFFSSFWVKNHERSLNGKGKSTIFGKPLIGFFFVLDWSLKVSCYVFTWNFWLPTFTGLYFLCSNSNVTVLRFFWILYLLYSGWTFSLSRYSLYHWLCDGWAWEVGSEIPCCFEVNFYPFLFPFAEDAVIMVSNSLSVRVYLMFETTDIDLHYVPIFISFHHSLLQKKLIELQRILDLKGFPVHTKELMLMTA